MTLSSFAPAVRRILLFCAFSTVAVGIFFCLGGICALISPSEPDSSSQAAFLNNGTLFIRGEINERLQKLVQVALESKPHLTAINVSSPGGDTEYAARLATILAPYRSVPVVVDDTSRCASACVGLLVSLGPWNVHPKGLIMFHSSRRISNSSSCLPCRWQNLILGYSSRFLERHIFNDHPLMQPWANRLIPGLGDALARCHPNPLWEWGGTYISGKTLIALETKGLSGWDCRFGPIGGS